MISPSWFGANNQAALYTQFRIMRFRDGVHYPVTTFWTDKPLSRISKDMVYFFSPALRKYSKNIVEGSFVLWLDFDDREELPEFHIPPSLVVSSGGGFHVYFRASEFIFPDTLSLYLDRLVSFYKSDVMAKDITRFMRFPNSYNLKYAPVRMAQIVSMREEKYELSQIMAF
jgi:hypothetical protein